MTPRAELVDILRAGLPNSTYQVRDYNTDDVGNTKKRVVTVQTTALAASLAFRSWQATVVVDVVVPHEDYAKAEAALEVSLVDVLGVLRDSQVADVLTSADRIVRADTRHAWRLTLTLPLKED